MHVRFRFAFAVVVSLAMSAVAAAQQSTTRPIGAEGAIVAQQTIPIAPPAKKSIYDDQTLSVNGKTPAAASSDATATGSQDQTASGLDLPRIGLSLAIVISLIAVLVWIYRRFFGGAVAQRNSGVMSVLTRLTVTPKQHLVLLQVGRRLVVACDNGVQMSPLTEITDPDEVASMIGQLASEKNLSAVKAIGSFGSAFGRARSDFDEPVSEMSSEPEDVPEEDSQITEARGEITGLMDKIRLLSGQIRRS
jgi:flagellar biogenesis protein FliO